MTERDGTTIDVQSIGIDRQLAKTRNDLRGKRFVQLDDIHLIERQPGEFQGFADRRL